MWYWLIDKREYENRISEYINIIPLIAKKLYYNYKYESALEYFDRAIENNPYDDDLWLYKAKCLEELMKYEEAIECYDRLIAIDSFSANYELWDAHRLNLRSEMETLEKLKNHNETTEISPIAKYHLKATSLKKLGRYEEAIEYYNKVISIDLEYENPMAKKAECLVKLGRYEEAIEWYNKAKEQWVFHI